MKFTYRTLLELTAIVAMTAVVFVLAFLQYRWTGEISRADQASLKAGLTTSVRNFSQDFTYDFQRLCESLETDPDTTPVDIESLIQSKFADWTKTTSHADLVSALFIWKTSERGTLLESLDRTNNRFQPYSWTPELESLRQFLGEQSQRFSFVMPDREAVYYPWTFYEETPALVRPLFRIASAGEEGADLRPVGFLVVLLDTDVLQHRYLPELVARAFGTSTADLAIAVRTAGKPYSAIYTSTPDFPVATTTPDASINLFDAIAAEARRRGHPPLVPSADEQQWQLVVQHATGSLDVAMVAFRRRNLAISLSLLAVLAGTIVLVFSVFRRSQRLAKLQMEFVAGVSHELCTPLAVINSAAENLADGVVEDPSQLHAYGGMIRDQGRRLERLVDEVLLFAAGRFGRAGYDLRPVEVAPIIQQTLAVSEPMLRESDFAVEEKVPDDLPCVVADANALSKCVENLVSNAVKYAGPNKWISVRARANGAPRKPEVQVIVEDKGIGMSSADLPHIFEPFYRVQAVRDGQIRGVGLGLYLVKRTMEAMGGRVTVSSELGHGTVFTLHLPVANGHRGDQPS